MNKAVSFMLWMWVIVSLAGGVVQGTSVTMAATRLTADISASATTINVTSTTGFPGAGIISIGDERVAYSKTSATSFYGIIVINPLVRGASGTTAAAHSTGAVVRTVESSMLNSSISYKLATMADSSGIMAFVTIPYSFISLLVSFFVLPLGFLGGDLQILTYIWGILTISLIVSIAIQLAGGRHV